MFFRKAREISALTRELCKKDDEIKRLERKDSESRATIEELKDSIFEIQTYYKTPDGCIPGPYCKGCGFKKEFEIMDYSNNYFGFGEYAYRGPKPIKVRVCGKGNVCRSFMQSEN